MSKFLARPLAIAIQRAVFVGFLGSSAMTTQSVMAQNAESYQYNIPASSLDRALSLFSAQSGIEFAFDPKQVKHLYSQGLKGVYTVDTGFSALLAPHGLDIQYTTNGYKLIKKGPNQVRNMGQLKTIDINANGQLNDTTDAVRLPVIMITAEQNNKVNLGKAEQSIKEIPQSITVVNREQLEKQNLTDLSTALDKVAGISVWQGQVFENTFIARGMEVSNIRVDGVSSALKLQDLSQFEQIEVLRGADGLFNGNGEASASINLVRKKPLRENQIAVELSAGSWENYRASIDVTGPIALDGALRGRLVGTWNDQDFFYAVAEKNRHSVYGILEYDILLTTTASIGFSYDKLQGKQDWIGLPRYIDGSDIGFDRKTSFVTNWANIKAESTQYFAGIQHDFNQDWKLKFNITKEHMLKLNEYPRLGGSVDPKTNITQLAFIKNGGEPDSWVGDINIQGKFNLFGKQHSTVFGIDYQDKKDPFHYMSDPLQYYDLNIFKFDPNMKYKAVHGYKPTRTLYTKQLGYYATAKWQISDPLKFITGARLNNYDFYQRNDTTGATTYDYEDNNVFIPFVGLTYDITPDWLVFASVAETFKSQANLLDVNKKPLDPITGRNYEVGIKGELWDGQGNLSLSTYRTERKNQGNLLYSETMDDGNGSSCCYVGGNAVTMSGVDFELTGEILPNLTGSIGYTYFDNKDHFNAISWRKITTPRHTLKAWLDYKLEDWTVGINVSAQSEQQATGSTPTTYDESTGQWGEPYVDYQFKSPSRAVWGTQVGYQINPNLHAAFRINNLFDKVYWQTIGDTEGYNWYGEPRNFMLTLRAKY
ncbi:TonB-dependent receptor [Acinetobacter puyangensis]|nr:TonB-dependent receptor [Acinetobacter puyangensis]